MRIFSRMRRYAMERSAYPYPDDATSLRLEVP